MQSELLEKARLVTPDAAKNYVMVLGWKLVFHQLEEIAVYQNPTFSLRQITVPLDQKLDDYGERMVEAIEKMAEFERRPAIEVLVRLLPDKTLENVKQLLATATRDQLIEVRETVNKMLKEK